MKFLLPPSLSSCGSARPDDLDGLLRAFYQAEMPQPWPDLDPPARTILPPPRVSFWHRITRSHLALAASIALLIVGTLLLSGKMAIHFVPGIGEIGARDPDDPRHQPNKETSPATPVGKDNRSIKESIIVGPDGAGVLIEAEENRY